jgi:hypothetical protein
MQVRHNGQWIDMTAGESRGMIANGYRLAFGTTRGMEVSHFCLLGEMLCRQECQNVGQCVDGVDCLHHVMIVRD